MRDFPSCFGENGVQVADSSSSSIGVSKASQNTVTCIYKCKLLDKSCLISIIWSKGLMGQCLSIEIDDASHQFIYKVDVKPSLFSKRKGSKCLQVNLGKIEVFWDLSMAKFGSGPEPLESYFIGIVCKGEMVLLIGDLTEEAFKKTGAIARLSSAIFVSKREHVCGKTIFGTKAQFCDNGQIHDLKIECDTNCSDDPFLVVRIDAKTVMQVKHLRWKFRGNFTIMVDGLPVEVFWDVHNWLFSPSLGNAVFMFQTSLSVEKMWASPSRPSDSSVLSWSSLENFKESKLPGASSAGRRPAMGHQGPEFNTYQLQLLLMSPWARRWGARGYPKFGPKDPATGNNQNVSLQEQRTASQEPYFCLLPERPGPIPRLTLRIVNMVLSQLAPLYCQKFG
ncbi:hypothetical protein DH2020_043580 [Rehmannia glutinosa]|uniref:DUF868 domain-containing protein n=1 Tax=Rehmannia glutinosa TaxID=99300 RepID=A0ABR0UKZ5_REHGL